MDSASPTIIVVLGLGLALGLKHATDVDHIVAVSTLVVSEQRPSRSALVGALWGAGHTASLLIVGVLVLALQIAIPSSIAVGLEFSVALMLIVLGVLAIFRVRRGSSPLHLHSHTHGGRSHTHLHFHEATERYGNPHSHTISKLGFKPLLVGGIHGLAGSAALSVLMLAQLKSVWLGIFYLLLFGLGSVCGMVLISIVIGLPFSLYTRNPARTYVQRRVQTFGGALSILFGLWYAYQLNN